MSVPVFAVVGQPNKGKSSIVATLAEDERIGISPVPGTTRVAAPLTFSVNGTALYTLVDTPGFQRARSVLQWLQERQNDASQRSALVRQFVDEHEDDERFRDECELLRPIIEGAGILYVVDGAKPYGAEYEIEMQILQWTGMPRMALINRIGEEDYTADWRRALDQYFSIVREFDAVSADFPTRLKLLGAFAELNEDWRPALTQAVNVLTQERKRRLRASAVEIAGCLLDCLSAQEKQPFDEGRAEEEQQERLRGVLFRKLRAREQRCRNTVQSIYRHHSSQAPASELGLVDMDLFAEEGWELFGLSREKLVVAGVLGGAAAGGGVDLLLGGASLLLGSVIGGVLGGASAWFGGQEIAKVSILGETLGGRMLVVGPVTAANFPWVLLGRAVSHHRLFSERNHARRESLSESMEASSHLMDELPEEHRREIARCFKQIRDDGGSGNVLQRLTACVEQCLGTEEFGS